MSYHDRSGFTPSGRPNYLATTHPLHPEKLSYQALGRDGEGRLYAVFVREDGCSLEFQVHSQGSVEFEKAVRPLRNPQIAFRLAHREIMWAPMGEDWQKVASHMGESVYQGHRYLGACRWLRHDGRIMNAGFRYG
jgi:hypothetical protein